MIQVLSRQLSVPWVSLQHVDFSRQLLNLVPHAVAEAWASCPCSCGADATRRRSRRDRRPDERRGVEAIREAVKLETRPMIAAASHIREALRVYYGVGQKPGLSDADETPRPSRVAPPPRPPPPRPRPEATPKPSRRPVRRASRRPACGTTTSRWRSSASARSTSPTARATRAWSPSRCSTAPPCGCPPAVQGDGTEASGLADGLTARDLVAALRAAAQGADASEVLGKDARLEPVVAALLEVLLKKGVFADWELAEALRKKG